MKELQLPKAIPIRFYFDGEKPKTQASGEGLTEMAVIERNGLEILSAAKMMEDRMIEAVGKILFGSNNENQKTGSSLKTKSWPPRIFRIRLNAGHLLDCLSNTTS